LVHIAVLTVYRSIWTLYIFNDCLWKHVLFVLVTYWLIIIINIITLPEWTKLFIAYVLSCHLGYINSLSVLIEQTAMQPESCIVTTQCYTATYSW